MREDYALYDIDGKGAKALLIGKKNPDGYVNEIYTIKDGAAERKLAKTHDTDEGKIIMRKSGRIYLGRADTPWILGYSRLYRFEDGQIKLMVGWGTYWNDKGVFRVDPTGTDRDFLFDFIPDGTEVRITGDEYNRLCEEFIEDREPPELDWHPLTEYGQ